MMLTSECKKEFHQKQNVSLNKIFKFKKIKQILALKLFECSDCSKRFSSMKLVVQHFKKVHTKREFSCVLCLKSFAYERDLKYHSAKKCTGEPKIIISSKKPRKK